LKPHLALVAVQIFFGTWPIVGKIALRTLPSTGLVALRVAGATLAFLCLRRLTARPRITQRSDYARLALYSLLGVVLNQFLYVKGLALSTVINATILSTTIPIAALLVSILMGRERPAPRIFIGMLVAACGVVYLINPAHADFSRDTMIGNLLLILNTLAYGAYIAVSQDLIKRYGALTVITWIFLFGSVATLPVGGYYLAQTPLTHLSASLWFAIAYIILVPTVGAYYLNAWALGRVAPRSEEHTSELQSQSNLVCRLLLEKKKKSITTILNRRGSLTVQRLTLMTLIKIILVMLSVSALYQTFGLLRFLLILLLLAHFTLPP